jgi:hypothetical protein
MGTTRRGKFDGRLTPLAVRRLSEPGLYSDGSGLYLQVSGARGRSWVLVYHLDGRRREMGLGSAADWSLAEARARARHYRRLLADGIDVIEHRRAELAAKAEARRSRRTFAEAAAAYIVAHRAGWRSAKHAAQWESTLAQHAGSLNALDVSAIGKAELLAVLSPVWQEL